MLHLPCGVSVWGVARIEQLFFGHRLMPLSSLKPFSTHTRYYLNQMTQQFADW